MTSFVITLYGRCCHRHVVDQRVVSVVSIVRSCWSICSLCSESNDVNLVLRRLIPEPLLCFTYQTCLDLQDGGVYLVDTDREFSDITAACL